MKQFHLMKEPISCQVSQRLQDLNHYYGRELVHAIIEGCLLHVELSVHINNLRNAFPEQFNDMYSIIYLERLVS